MILIQHQHIPEIFNSNDILYHYCDIDTAIKYILFEEKLRLSPRKKSIDPVENSSGWFSYGSHGYTYRDYASEDEKAQAANIIRKKVNNIKQLSFCMNSQEDLSGQSFMLPYEHYGFTKPRMWDQYGDKYKGICLAFSKKNLELDSKYIPKTVQYVDYKKLSNNLSIDLNALKENGVTKYCEEFIKKLEPRLFKKHSDYSGENEYRICSFGESEFDYIPIKESLIGIIIPDNIGKFDLNSIKKFSTKLNAELLYLSWGNGRICVNSESENKKLIEKLNLEINPPVKE